MVVGLAVLVGFAIFLGAIARGYQVELSGADRRSAGMRAGTLRARHTVVLLVEWAVAAVVVYTAGGFALTMFARDENWQPGVVSTNGGASGDENTSKIGFHIWAIPGYSGPVNVYLGEHSLGANWEGHVTLTLHGPAGANDIVASADNQASFPSQLSDNTERVFARMVITVPPNAALPSDWSGTVTGTIRVATGDASTYSVDSVDLSYKIQLHVSAPSEIDRHTHNGGLYGTELPLSVLLWLFGSIYTLWFWWPAKQRS
jgi:hypothetical protein